jgi:hypothetical protein
MDIHQGGYIERSFHPWRGSVSRRIARWDCEKQVANREEKVIVHRPRTILRIVDLEIRRALAESVAQVLKEK